MNNVTAMEVNTLRPCLANALDTMRQIEETA
jgi:hypothetical protein